MSHTGFMQTEKAGSQSCCANPAGTLNQVLNNQRSTCVNRSGVLIQTHIRSVTAPFCFDSMLLRWLDVLESHDRGLGPALHPNDVTLSWFMLGCKTSNLWSPGQALLKTTFFCYSQDK